MIEKELDFSSLLEESKEVHLWQLKLLSLYYAAGSKSRTWPLTCTSASQSLFSMMTMQTCHWTKSRISLCVTTYILALSCIYPAEDRAKFPTKCRKFVSILQISYNKEILLFTQCVFGSAESWLLNWTGKMIIWIIW